MRYEVGLMTRICLLKIEISHNSLGQLKSLRSLRSLRSLGSVILFNSRDLDSFRATKSRISNEYSDLVSFFEFKMGYKVTSRTI